MKHLLDLRGVICPMNFVKAKLKLEEIGEGEKLELWLDDGEAIRNVPRSLKDEGHEILEFEREESYFKLVVKKRGGLNGT